MIGCAKFENRSSKMISETSNFFKVLIKLKNPSVLNYKDLQNLATRHSPYIRHGASENDTRTVRRVARNQAGSLDRLNFGS